MDLSYDTLEECIDVSLHNGKIDWSAVKNSGKTFAFVKATEGVHFRDPLFLDNWQAMSDLGMKRGLYHFVRFDIHTVQRQMDNLSDYLAQASYNKDKDIVALDIEENSGSEQPDYTCVGRITEQLVRMIKDKLGCYPYIYTRENFWDKYVAETPDIVKECPLWIARWRAKEPAPEELPKGWNHWQVWQYTDKATVPGISGYVDLDRMISIV